MTEHFIETTRFRITNMLDERRPVDGLLGLPAFFTLILLAFMVLNSRDDSSRENLNRLEREAQSQLDQGHFAAARLAAIRKRVERLPFGAARDALESKMRAVEARNDASDELD